MQVPQRTKTCVYLFHFSRFILGAILAMTLAKFSAFDRPDRDINCERCTRPRTGLGIERECGWAKGQISDYVSSCLLVFNRYFNTLSEPDKNRIAESSFSWSIIMFYSSFMLWMSRGIISYLITVCDQDLKTTWRVVLLHKFLITYIYILLSWMWIGKIGAGCYNLKKNTCNFFIGTSWKSYSSFN